MSLTNILTNAITSTQTEILMVNPNIFPSGPGVVTIGSEQIHFAAASSNSLLDCTRGYNSTSAASALKGATVTLTSNDEPIGTGDLIGTAPVSVANGLETLAGASATISMHVADSTHSGYLASTDFSRLANTSGTNTGDQNLSSYRLISSGGVISVVATDPVSPIEGQVWYNTTSHLLKFYDGTTVQTVAHV
jgi:hypothetical protein